MKLRDLSIRKRLLAGNFLMVLIPLVIMTVVSAGLMGLIRHAPWEQHRNLDTFFPNAGRGVAIQFTLGILQGDINDPADRQDSLINIQDDVKRLATFGVYSAVIYNDQLIYQNENLGDPQLNLLRHIGNDEKSSYIWWDEKGLTYRYVSSKDNLIVLGYAPIEFRVGMPKLTNRDSGPITFWDQLQGQGAVITMIIGGIVILILGIYLSTSNQVFCITHLPQTASIGRHHYHLEKEEVDGRTISTIRKLNQEEHLAHIAAIMSGREISDTALVTARKLMHHFGVIYED